MAIRQPRTSATATEIGAALEAERMRRRFTQTEAAKALGVSQIGYSNWSRGTRLPASIDPRILASFLHHEDGTPWSTEEVLDVLARDRAGREG